MSRTDEIRDGLTAVRQRIARSCEGAGRDPGEVTLVNAYFDIPGRYVWHCHILSHEDNEMMRPMCVLPSATSAVSSICPSLQ